MLHVGDLLNSVFVTYEFTHTNLVKGLNLLLLQGKPLCFSSARYE